MKQKILYLSYNGMMEPLGASQVLSYLYHLSADYQYYLVSLEKPADLADKSAFLQLRTKLKEAGIVWIPIEYRTSKTGKAINFVRFLNTAKVAVKKYGIRFLHCRSYLPAFAAWLIKKNHPVEYLFDTRGFEFDERADVGSISRSSRIFKLMKSLEKKLYRDAAGINKLSRLGKKTIVENGLFKGGNLLEERIDVIPTCVDIGRFPYKPRTYREPLNIGYVGTAVGWYDFDKTLDLVEELSKNVPVSLTVYNGNEHDYIRQKIAERDITLHNFTLEKVPFSEMPKKMMDIDLAVFYIRPVFSKRASAATKLGELLSAGIPVLTNDGIGDHRFYIENYRAGKIIDFDHLKQYDFKNMLQGMVSPEVSQNCRHVAEEFFSLEKGVDNYKNQYRKFFGI
ncbi:hypothetical protein CO230_01525 [Chryseobacterium sp. 6424]|uniref:hypothetical protein n=1 Tax=Chryseobacterium sp. 6424 TaxID=2039166 RepID=UPI000EFAF990|nr:hypothetical protein [Chryseobacterium sp. 6424]AYO56924.1 hypothetical protein CO230_01525 [Chryseobacterium sp. 6424]